MVLIGALGLEMVQIFLILALAPLFTGLVRKIKARLQRRIGPSLFQPYRDLARLFRKETVVANNASWLYFAAPVVIFAATWVAATLVPTLTFSVALTPMVDLIALFGLLALARFAQALAGLDIGTSFGGLGASREMMIAALAEPALLLLIFTLALLTGSSRLPDIAHFVQSPAVGLHISLLLTFVGFGIIAIAESGRLPVDNPATHLELTMIHEAMVLEYSGGHLALIEWASSVKLLLYVSLIAAIFLPIGIAQTGDGFIALGIALALYLLKLMLAAGIIGVYELSDAKMRVFRIPNFLGTGLMLALLAALLSLVSRIF